MTPTKEQFLNHLREKWVSRFGWAHDKTKLENALAEAANTLNGKRTCLIGSPSWVETWRELGLKGKPTYKGLHELPTNKTEAA